jgi:hypothetical protein
VEHRSCRARGSPAAAPFVKGRPSGTYVPPSRSLSESPGSGAALVMEPAEVE